MLLPRFTIRWLLLLMTVSAVFCLVITFAVRGQAWALGITVAIGSLLLAFACYAAVFLVAFIVGGVFGVLAGKPAPTSPFATESLPPQILPREEPVE